MPSDKIAAFYEFAQNDNSEKFTVECHAKTIFVLRNGQAFMGIDQLTFVFSCRA